MPQNPPPLPDFTRWPSFPFEGDMRVKHLAEPVAVEPPRSGEDASDCVACNTPDDAYIWVSERWRVRGMDRPTGLPIVLILECRSHLDIGDLPNLLAAELGVMTVRLERSIRSLDGVARVHVNRWGDGSAHLHMWFLARPYGRLQLRGTFLSLWDDILPVIPEEQWLENLALVAEWLAGFGGRAIAEPPHIHWLSPSTFGNDTTSAPDTTAFVAAVDEAFVADAGSDHSAGGTSNHYYSPEATDSESAYPHDSPVTRSDLTEVSAETRDLSSYVNQFGTATPTAEGDAHADNELGDQGESAESDRLPESGQLKDGAEPQGTGQLEDSGEPGETIGLANSAESERKAGHETRTESERKAGHETSTESASNAGHETSAESEHKAGHESGTQPAENDRPGGKAQDNGRPDSDANLKGGVELDGEGEPRESSSPAIEVPVNGDAINGTTTAERTIPTQHTPTKTPDSSAPTTLAQPR